MSRNLLFLAAPVLGMCVNVLIHLILCRIRSVGHLHRIVGALLAGAVLLVWWIWYWLPSDFAATAGSAGGLALTSLMSYVGLGYCYFTLVNLTATSLRIRILRLLWNAPHHRKLASEIRAQYDASELVQLRLTRLDEWRQIQRRSGIVYVVGYPKFLILAKIILILRRALSPSRPVGTRRT